MDATFHMKRGVCTMVSVNPILIPQMRERPDADFKVDVRSKVLRCTTRSLRAHTIEQVGFGE